MLKFLEVAITVVMLIPILYVCFENRIQKSQTQNSPEKRKRSA